MNSVTPNTIDLTRTFHPVGQGAFYSERFSFNDNLDFLTVYDCGTDLRNRKLGTEAEILSGLEARIDQDLGAANPTSGKHDVQLLFISHFDEDHVSGIHTLNPKTVVIPLLTEEEITCYELLDFLQVIRVNWNLLRNPKRFFGSDTTVIGIEPDYEEEDLPDFEESLEIDEEGFIRNGNRNRRQYPSPQSPYVDITIPSGSPIRLRNLWQYIAFNPKISKLNAFKNALSSAGWDWNTLADDLKTNLSRDKVRQLHDIYKNISPNGKLDLNTTSLLVYSGPTNELKKKSIRRSVISYSHRSHVDLHHPDSFPTIHRNRICMACMYFGDWKINEKKIQRYYQHPLISKELICTVQIPHHGSRYNNCHYALKYLKHPKRVISVISHGDKNRHKHPSSKTIADILKLGHYICHVTEQDSSAFITHWKLTH